MRNRSGRVKTITPLALRLRKTLGCRRYSTARLSVATRRRLRGDQTGWRRTKTDAKIVTERCLPAIGTGGGNPRAIARDFPDGFADWTKDGIMFVGLLATVYQVSPIPALHHSANGCQIALHNVIARHSSTSSLLRGTTIVEAVQDRIPRLDGLFLVHW
jgi:hypothetical protein